MDRSSLGRLLTLLHHWEGSDLHLKVGAPPRVRIGGLLRQALAEPPCTPVDLEQLAGEIMSEHDARRFAREHQVTFTYPVSGVGRFRAYVFAQRGTVALTFRRRRWHTGTIEQLGLPPILGTLAERASGLVLVVGPHDSGKSTTLSAMVDHINRVRACTVVTIEDPIEYLHADVFSSITQREVGLDTDSAAAAVRGALRQDADVVVVGDASDAETFAGVLSAASAGQLVLAGLEAADASDAIARLAATFPPALDHQLRATLARSLVAVVTQRLQPADALGDRAPAVDVLLADAQVARLIEAPGAPDLPLALSVPPIP